MSEPDTPSPLERAATVANECVDCADNYQKFPGLAGPGANAGTVADLYLTIARLARIVERLQAGDSQ